MKRLFLLRHAQAADRSAGMRDFDRPLTAKGRKDAALIGRFLADNNHRIDAALCSPSARTLETFEAVSTFLAEPPHILFNDGIYNATTRELLAAVQSAPDEIEHLLLVGHNPGIHQLALELAAASGGDAMMKLSRSFPKGALAEYEFDIASWPETKFGAGGLRKFTRPKQLRGG